MRAPASLLTALLLPAIASAALVCDEPAYNFGEKDSRLKVEHKFILHNRSEAKVLIKDVTSSCGCTVPKISSREVEPGQSVEVDVVFDLSGRNGKQAKAVFVTDDSGQNLELTLNGTALSKYVLKPPGLFFGKIPASRQMANETKLIVNAESPFLVTGVKCDSPAFEVTCDTLIEKQEYRIRVVTKPPLLSGRINTEIVVSTNDKDCPKVFVPVSANVAGPYTVTPEEVVLDEGAAKMSTMLVVSQGDVTRFVVLEAGIPGTEIKSSISPFGQSAYRIQFDNLNANELREKSIRIVTDSSVASEIFVPIRVQKPRK